MSACESEKGQVTPPQQHEEPSGGETLVLSPETGPQQRTSTNIRSAVNIFKRWFYNHYATAPSPENVPPVELDKHLADFFSTIRQHDGRDYSVQSLLSLRKRIARHLKLQGYPVSMLTSKEFSESQRAFQTKLTQLRLGDSGLGDIEILTVLG